MQAHGNVVLITGGTSGIGLALARRLAAGNLVMVCGRDEERLAAARDAVPGLATIRADVANPVDRATLVARVEAEFGGLNVLVNNAGRLEVCDPADSAIVSVLEAELATNLVAPVALTAMLLPLLRRAKRATVAVDTAMAGHYAGVKMTPDAVAAAIHAGLLAGRGEIAIGMSRAARVLARVAPGVAFTAMNRMEARSAGAGRHRSP